MAFEEIEKQESSIAAIKRICQGAYYFVVALYLVFGITWFLLLCVSVISLVFPGTIPFVHVVDWLAILANFLYALIVFLMIKTGAGLFKEILQSRSPFTSAQAKRIRRISYLLVLKCIIEAIFPAKFLPVIDSGGIELSYISMNPETFIIFINPETLLFAVLFFCISLVFQYGVLLQRDSQDFI